MIQTFKSFWKFSKNRHGLFIKALLMSFIRAFIGITQLVAISLVIDVLTRGAAEESVIWKLVLLMITCLVGSFISSFTESAGSVATGFYMTADKRIELGNFMKRLPLGFFTENASGKIVASLTTGLSGVETGATMAMVTTVSGFFSAFALFVAICFYEWHVGVITAVGMLLYLVTVDLQMRISRERGPLLQKAQNKLAEATLNFLQGVKVTKVFSVKEGDAELNLSIEASREANILFTNQVMPVQFLSRLIIAVFEIFIFICALYLHSRGEIPLVKTILLLIFSFMAYMSLNQAGSILSMIGILDSGLRDIEEIESVKQMEWESAPQPMGSNDIQFEHVHFSYGENEVLHNVSAKIPEGSFTAIIGPSGSGKTSLCELIPRFRDVDSGRVTIGGADVRKVEYEELMKRISIVFQRVYLFEDSIFNNIAIGKPDASPKEVKAAARAACCDDFIQKLPKGYDTVLDEGGSSLSGGEKQRISIARAILKDSPIIILDEATSALDAENEHEILSAIEALTKNKTVIMIAHRIKSVSKADQVIVLKEGRVVQDGPPAELAVQEGLYRDFLQTRANASGWTLKN